MTTRTHLSCVSSSAAGTTAGAGKRNRIALAPEYTERYTRETLDRFDLGALVAELPRDSATGSNPGGGP